MVAKIPVYPICRSSAYCGTEVQGARLHSFRLASFGYSLQFSSNVRSYNKSHRDTTSLVMDATMVVGDTLPYIFLCPWL